MNARTPRGFTLIELLMVTAIIGFLSTTGVVSYNFIRVKARDTKRVADIRTLHQAIELYYDRYDSYPSVQTGILLGSPEAMEFSVGGFTAPGQGREPVFLLNVPRNVEPGGVPYVYRSTNEDGSLCTSECQHYEVTFSLETEVANYKSGLHYLTDLAIKGAEGGYTDLEAPTLLQSYAPSGQDLALAFDTTKEALDAGRQIVAGRPEVQTAGKVAAPAALVAVGANFIAIAASAIPAANAGQMLLTLLSQPFHFLNRKKRRTWGTVYDSATKVPVDLATVRLIDAATNRAVGTKVTDKDGRYAFSPRPGTYRLEVAKLNYTFPSAALSGVTDDGQYLDVYHGTLVRVEAEHQPVTVNIPVDPKEDAPQDVRELLSQKNLRQLKRALAMSGPIIGLASLVITPSTITGVLFLSHLLVYFGFKRLTEPKIPKNQGIVFDEETRDPVPQAVVRIFSLPYHKVLETKVTDSRGRYSFYVGNGMYYLTIVKQGYEKTETDPIDFTAVEQPTFIASDLPLRRVGAAPAPVEAPQSTVTPAPTEETPPPGEPAPPAGQ
jgi:prepilin-type N-terminal cleavage/methylation domain-containing protein